MTNRQKRKIYNWLSAILPDFGVFKRFRKAFLRRCGVFVHQSVDLCGTVRFVGDGEVVIGENSIIRDGVFFHVAQGGRIELGQNVTVAENAILESIPSLDESTLLKFGDNVTFMMGSIASANGNATVRVGNNCKIAHNVSIKASGHKIVPDGKCIAEDCIFRDITISDGCWICAGAIILPGVTVGRWNVVAAGAVVTKDTPDCVLMAGVPAVLKKNYPRISRCRQ